MTFYACVTVHRGWLGSAVSIEMVTVLLAAFADYVELAGLPFIYLAEMGARRVNLQTRIYGTEMDVCNAYSCIKNLRGWKSDPSEIALYESEWSSLQGFA